MSPAPPPSLLTLPDEIIQCILRYVAPQEVLSSVGLVSRRLHDCSQEPLLWRFYCRDTFRYWASYHDFLGKLRAPVQEVDWRRLLILRLDRNSHIASLLDTILKSRVSRLQHTETICRYAYDAKDFLLSQCHCPDDAVDVLARRFHAGSLLDSIHRSIAVAEWDKYHHAGKPSTSTSNVSLQPSDKWNRGMLLERALGAFDLFMLHDNPGDLDEISGLLDHIAADFRDAHPGVDSLATRPRAVALARWLRAHDLTGLNDPDHTYRYLRNSLIGRALRDDRHPSIPIISCAIYACLGLRLGLEAHCCALPNHVHVIVLAPQGVSLDGQPIPAESDSGDGAADDGVGGREKMFLDPYGSEEEVPLNDIQGFLSRLGFGQSDNLLCPTPTDLIVVRTAQSIRAAFTSFRTIDRPIAQLIPMVELSRGDWACNLKPALYSMLWANALMVPMQWNNETRWDWMQDVLDLLNYFEEHFPQDAWLVQRFICPMLNNFAAGGPNHGASHRVVNQIEDIRRRDAQNQPQRSRHRLPDNVQLRYRVGQVFRHRRYDYRGLIVGWQVSCPETSFNASQPGQQAPLTWYSTRGDAKPMKFYRCMVGTDGSDHHRIAEENIEAEDLRGVASVEDLPREIRDLVPLAGKFFNRWDPIDGVFVSNIREVYPDD